MKIRQGFTLIELLVVLSIVAVLATLAIPRYYNQIDGSKETVLRHNLKQTRETIDHFYGDMGRYPESLQELVERRYLAELPIDPMTESDKTWVIEAPPDGYKGNVYNLHSGSKESGRGGGAYADW